MFPIVPYGSPTRWLNAVQQPRYAVPYEALPVDTPQPWSTAQFVDDLAVSVSTTVESLIGASTQFIDISSFASHALALTQYWQDLVLPTFNLVERHSAISLIKTMEGLAEGWDGYGAASIAGEISRTAATIVSNLPEYIPTPEVSANANGTISLEWENDLGRAHLEIGLRSYSCYVRKWQGETRYRDGLVDEINSSKKDLLGTLYSALPSQDISISQILDRPA